MVVDEALMLDVWGVLHDGEVVYKDAQPFLTAQAVAGRPVVMVSNATWSGERLRRHLTSLGLDLKGVVGFLTAGEIARRQLASLNVKRVHLVGLAEHQWLIPDDMVHTSLAEAEVLLLASLAPGAQGVMARALQLGLPVVCANPDTYIADRFNNRQVRAGSLLSAFEDAGGVVIRAGKPSPMIFDAAKRMVKARHWTHLGDNVGTDLVGARRSGVDVIWLDRFGHPDVQAVVDEHQPVAVWSTLDHTW